MPTVHPLLAILPCIWLRKTSEDEWVREEAGRGKGSSRRRFKLQLCQVLACELELFSLPFLTLCLLKYKTGIIISAL